jgi:hypothetical protein
VAGAEDDSGAVEALARHAEAVATLRAFAARSAAERVVLLVDRGDDQQAVMLEYADDGTIELTDGGHTWTIAASTTTAADPRPLPEVRPAPASAIHADPDTGELAAPLGVVNNLSAAVLGLARAFGGRSVATAEFATHDPDLPMTIVAREGEPLLLAVGDGRFELPL